MMDARINSAVYVKVQSERMNFLLSISPGKEMVSHSLPGLMLSMFSWFHIAL